MVFIRQTEKEKNRIVNLASLNKSSGNGTLIHRGSRSRGCVWVMQVWGAIVATPARVWYPLYANLTSYTLSFSLCLLCPFSLRMFPHKHTRTSFNNRYFCSIRSATKMTHHIQKGCTCFFFFFSFFPTEGIRKLHWVFYKEIDLEIQQSGRIGGLQGSLFQYTAWAVVILSFHTTYLIQDIQLLRIVLTAINQPAGFSVCRTYNESRRYSYANGV